jgi:uncharacterized protein
MKRFLSFFIILIFASFSILNAKDIKYSKNSLIKKADKGDIKAMISLYDYYQFPETKEGFDYYKKWYNTIDEKDSPKDILAFAKVFIDYKEMFINGDDKLLHLLNLSLKSNNEDELFSLLKFLYLVKNNTKYIYIKIDKTLYDKVENKLLKLATTKILDELNLYYEKINEFNKAWNIRKLMKERGYKESFPAKLEKLEKLYTSHKEKRKDIENILNDIIKTKDIKKILKAAKTITKRKYYVYKNAVTLLNSALKYDSKNPQIYLKLSSIYNYTDSTKSIKKDAKKSFEYLKKAAFLNSYEASSSIFRSYASEWKNYWIHLTADEKKEYFILKKKLLKTSEGKRALADIFYKSKKKDTSNKLLDELANKGDEKAILTLALRTSYQSEFNPEEEKLAQKWRKYIVKSHNTFLKNELKKYANPSKEYSPFKNIAKELYEKELKEQNIITLTKYYYWFKDIAPNIVLPYLKEASSYGSNYSNHELAKYYLKKKPEKAIEIYKNLANQGDKKAKEKLKIILEKGTK